MTAAYEVKLNGNIFRRSDGAWIPADPRNADYREYQAWAAVPENVPDAELPPEPPP